MKRLKFIHFVIDDKFIPDSIACFENSKLTDNIFYYFTKKQRELSFLDASIVKTITQNEALSIVTQGEGDVICLHSIFSLPYKIIAKINPKFKVIWYAWGADLYSNPKPTGPLLDIGDRFLPKTKEIIPNTFSRKLVNSIKDIVKLIIRRNNSTEDVHKAISRIDYFSGVFPIEHEMMIKSCKFFRAQRVTHNYIHPQEFDIKDIDEPIKVEGCNLLLGNSATYHINHVDVIEMIAPFVVQGTEIIVPLSYQGIPQYVDKVIEYGKRKFGNNFVPLKGYLPLDQYTKIMNSCNAVILGQKQQAATCNCLTALWNGLRLFLFEDSMNYKYYSSIGLKVFSIEKDFSCNPQLTKEDVDRNRKIIEGLYSYRQWVEDLKECISIISNC